MYPTMGQLDLFKKSFESDGTVSKNCEYDRTMNAIPYLLGLK